MAAARLLKGRTGHRARLSVRQSAARIDHNWNPADAFEVTDCRRWYHLWHTVSAAWNLGKQDHNMQRLVSHSQPYNFGHSFFCPSIIFDLISTIIWVHLRKNHSVKDDDKVLFIFIAIAAICEYSSNVAKDVRVSKKLYLKKNNCSCPICSFNLNSQWCFVPLLLPDAPPPPLFFYHLMRFLFTWTFTPLFLIINSITFWS